MCGGDYHQYYYMHPCLETINGDPICRDDMPFTMLGQHYLSNWSPYTTLDYLTFELFDDNGDIYYIFFSSAFQSWIKTSNMMCDTSLHDELDPSDTLNTLSSGVSITIGNRFEVLYTKSGTDYLLKLTIGGMCELSLSMYGWYPVNGRNRVHNLYVTPPECMYLCLSVNVVSDIVCFTINYKSVK